MSTLSGLLSTGMKGSSGGLLGGGLYILLEWALSSIGALLILLVLFICLLYTSGARNAAAIASFGLPRMPIALPTSFDQPFGNRVMSYTILGNATCLMH